MTKTTLDILKSGKRLENANSEVLALQSSIEEKKKDIEYKNTDSFIEEKARNELNMVLPGDKIYVVNDTQLSQEEAVVLGSVTENAVQDSNMYHWYKLFF